MKKDARFLMLAAIAAFVCRLSAETAVWTYNTVGGTMSDGTNWTLTVSVSDAAAKTLTVTGCSAGSGTLDLGGVVARAGDGDYRVTRIGASAFYHQASLTGRLDLPDGLVAVGQASFDSTGITEVHVASEQLESLGRYAFASCSSLSNVMLRSSSLRLIDEGCFFNCGSLASDVANIVNPGVTNIGNSAFYHCSKLTGTLTLTDIQSIAAAALDSTGLTSVRIASDDLTQLPRYVFSNCTLLSNVVIRASNLRDIGVGCFIYCVAITNDVADIVNPGVTNIGDGAFNFCYKLTGTLTLTNLQSVGTSAFDSAGMTGIDISSDGLTQLPNHVFASCGSLAQVVLRAPNLQNLGPAAFYGASVMTNLVIQAPKLKTFSSYCFLSCGAITNDVASIVKPDATDIGDCAFMGCGQMTGTLVLTNIQSLGIQSFHTCAKLQGVRMSSQSLTVLPAQCFAWDSGLTNAVADWPNLTFIGDYAFGGAGSMVADVAQMVPPGVTSVGYYAFGQDAKLFGDLVLTNLTALGELAFHSGQISSIRLSSRTLTAIPNQGFAHDAALTNVVLDLPALDTIAYYAFGVWNGLSPIRDLVIGATNLVAVDSAAFFASTRLENVVFWGACPTDTGALDHIVQGVPSSYQCAFRVSRQQAGWTALASPLTEDEKARADFPGGAAFGTYTTSGGKKVWLVQASSPYTPKGSVMYVR